MVQVKDPTTLAPEVGKDVEEIATILNQLPATQCRLMCLAFDIARALTAADTDTDKNKCPT